MKKINYIITKIFSKLFRGGKRKEFINNFFRRNGVVIGSNCSIFANILSSEPYLINIGNNVTISNDVQLITHDNSIIKPSKNALTDLFGMIIIEDNCFIGAHTVILPGITIKKNCIVAAGSVVTKSVFKENLIIGGNPARIIGDTNDFLRKNSKYGFNVHGMNYEQKKACILKGNLMKK